MAEDGFDVVCVGGALVGSSIAFALSENPDFDGTVCVIERDNTYDRCSSSRSQNSIREQFSTPVNIRLSQYAMEFFNEFHERVQVNGEAPKLNFVPRGYLFVASQEDKLAAMRENLVVQHAHGAEVQVLDGDELARRYPFMDCSDLVGGCLGTMKEGTIDGWSLLQGYRQRAVANNVTYIDGEVVSIQREANRVTSVTLASGRVIRAGHVVNTSGPRAKLTAQMVGLDIPVEPRARTSFIFGCRTPIEQHMPLIILPEGIHVRPDQTHFVCGTQPDIDNAVAYDDWEARTAEFEDKIWPVLARRIPQFDRVSIVTSWGGQYAYNTLDHNAILGPGSEIENFHFANGFSGHGLQQSPGVGRAISELITYGQFRTLDLTPLRYDRVERNEPYLETAII